MESNRSINTNAEDDNRRDLYTNLDVTTKHNYTTDEENDSDLYSNLDVTTKHNHTSDKENDSDLYTNLDVTIEQLQHKSNNEDENADVPNLKCAVAEETNQELDLFEDFIVSKEVEKETQKTGDLTNELRKTKVHLKYYKERCSGLEEDNTVLLQNISSLWKTAMVQLREKDKKMVKLKKEHEANKFFRAVRQIPKDELDRIVSRVVAYDKQDIADFIQQLSAEKLCECKSRPRNSFMPRKGPKEIMESVRGARVDVKKVQEAATLCKFLGNKRNSVTNSIRSNYLDGSFRNYLSNQNTGRALSKKRSPLKVRSSLVRHGSHPNFASLSNQRKFSNIAGPSNSENNSYINKQKDVDKRDYSRECGNKNYENKNIESPCKGPIVKLTEQSERYHTETNYNDEQSSGINSDFDLSKKTNYNETELAHHAEKSCENLPKNENKCGIECSEINANLPIVSLNAFSRRKMQKELAASQIENLNRNYALKTLEKSKCPESNSIHSNSVNEIEVQMVENSNVIPSNIVQDEQNNLKGLETADNRESQRDDTYNIQPSVEKKFNLGLCSTTSTCLNSDVGIVSAILSEPVPNTLCTKLNDLPSLNDASNLLSVPSDTHEHGPSNACNVEFNTLNSNKMPLREDSYSNFEVKQSKSCKNKVEPKISGSKELFKDFVPEKETVGSGGDIYTYRIPKKKITDYFELSVLSDSNHGKDVTNSSPQLGKVNKVLEAGDIHFNPTANLGIAKNFEIESSKGTSSKSKGYKGRSRKSPFDSREKNWPIEDTKFIQRGRPEEISSRAAYKKRSDYESISRTKHWNKSSSKSISPYRNGEPCPNKSKSKSRERKEHSEANCSSSRSRKFKDTYQSSRRGASNNDVKCSSSNYDARVHKKSSRSKSPRKCPSTSNSPCRSDHHHSKSSSRCITPKCKCDNYDSQFKASSSNRREKKDSYRHATITGSHSHDEKRKRSSVSPHSHGRSKCEVAQHLPEERRYPKNKCDSHRTTQDTDTMSLVNRLRKISCSSSFVNRFRRSVSRQSYRNQSSRRFAEPRCSMAKWQKQVEANKQRHYSREPFGNKYARAEYSKPLSTRNKPTRQDRAKEREVKVWHTNSNEDRHYLKEANTKQGNLRIPYNSTKIKKKESRRKMEIKETSNLTKIPNNVNKEEGEISCESKEEYINSSASSEENIFKKQYGIPPASTKPHSSPMFANKNLITKRNREQVSVEVSSPMENKVDGKLAMLPRPHSRAPTPATCPDNLNENEGSEIMFSQAQEHIDEIQTECAKPVTPPLLSSGNLDKVIEDNTETSSQIEESKNCENENRTIMDSKIEENINKKIVNAISPSSHFSQYEKVNVKNFSSNYPVPSGHYDTKSKKFKESNVESSLNVEISCNKPAELAPAKLFSSNHFDTASNCDASINESITPQKGKLCSFPIMRKEDVISNRETTCVTNNILPLSNNSKLEESPNYTFLEFGNEKSSVKSSTNEVAFNDKSSYIEEDTIDNIMRRHQQNNPEESYAPSSDDSETSLLQFISNKEGSESPIKEDKSKFIALSPPPFVIPPLRPSKVVSPFHELLYTTQNTLNKESAVMVTSSSLSNVRSPMENSSLSNRKKTDLLPDVDVGKHSNVDTSSFKSCGPVETFVDNRCNHRGEIGSSADVISRPLCGTLQSPFANQFPHPPPPCPVRSIDSVLNAVAHLSSPRFTATSKSLGTPSPKTLTTSSCSPIPISTPLNLPSDTTASFTPPPPLSSTMKSSTPIVAFDLDRKSRFFSHTVPELVQRVVSDRVRLNSNNFDPHTLTSTTPQVRGANGNVNNECNVQGNEHGKINMTDDVPNSVLQAESIASHETKQESEVERKENRNGETNISRGVKGGGGDSKNESDSHSFNHETSNVEESLSSSQVKKKKVPFITISREVSMDNFGLNPVNAFGDKKSEFKFVSSFNKKLDDLEESLTSFTKCFPLNKDSTLQDNLASGNRSIEGETVKEIEKENNNDNSDLVSANESLSSNCSSSSSSSSSSSTNSSSSDSTTTSCSRNSSTCSRCNVDAENKDANIDDSHHNNVEIKSPGSKVDLVVIERRRSPRKLKTPVKQPVLLNSSTSCASSKSPNTVGGERSLEGVENINNTEQLPVVALTPNKGTKSRNSGGSHSGHKQQKPQVSSCPPTLGSTLHKTPVHDSLVSPSKGSESSFASQGALMDVIQKSPCLMNELVNVLYHQGNSSSNANDISLKLLNDLSMKIKNKEILVESPTTSPTFSAPQTTNIQSADSEVVNSDISLKTELRKGKKWNKASISNHSDQKSSPTYSGSECNLHISEKKVAVGCQITQSGNLEQPLSNQLPKAVSSETSSGKQTSDSKCDKQVGVSSSSSIARGLQHKSNRNALTSLDANKIDSVKLDVAPKSLITNNEVPITGLTPKNKSTSKSASLISIQNASNSSSISTRNAGSSASISTGNNSNSLSMFANEEHKDNGDCDDATMTKALQPKLTKKEGNSKEENKNYTVVKVTPKNASSKKHITPKSMEKRSSDAQVGCAEKETLELNTTLKSHSSLSFPSTTTESENSDCDSSTPPAKAKRLKTNRKSSISKRVISSSSSSSEEESLKKSPTFQQSQVNKSIFNKNCKSLPKNRMAKRLSSPRIQSLTKESTPLLSNCKNKNSDRRIQELIKLHSENAFDVDKNDTTMKIPCNMDVVPNNTVSKNHLTHFNSGSADKNVSAKRVLVARRRAVKVITPNSVIVKGNSCTSPGNNLVCSSASNVISVVYQSPKKDRNGSRRGNKTNTRRKSSVEGDGEITSKLDKYSSPESRTLLCSNERVNVPVGNDMKAVKDIETNCKKKVKIANQEVGLKNKENLIHLANADNEVILDPNQINVSENISSNGRKPPGHNVTCSNVSTIHISQLKDPYKRKRKTPETKVPATVNQTNPRASPKDLQISNSEIQLDSPVIFRKFTKRRKVNLTSTIANVLTIEGSKK